ncbi:carbohydrate ABC transporter permease [Actinokineospora globicatena]|uniref:carbohydrate ABC transporter permease n=1 Tax=Actinokineospora globicatena TaxID=103729 RepID=UPI0020A297EB|nr:sugar ABC transporter permease [Actinokineospora globicatena]MCP2306466.1 carbohydrate ABC transporter membrane protein 1, CUT1 family [Actinokineospora globicatena]GLW81895.1 sugar ABC transporter permease [Actinokineospora globicatena]GLW88689.1 sugar ABC transporter permease [Actinokineospora globicatena]
MTAGRGQGRTALAYLSPALLVLVALLGYPVYQLVVISFFDYGQEQVSGGAPLEFLGLGNYSALLGSAKFWSVLGQTVAFAAVCVLGTLVVGAALAVLATRVRPWARTCLFLAALGAWATPAVAGSTIWLFLFDANFGLVNTVLGLDGFSWTYGKWTAFGLVAAEVVWCSFPFVMITLYAGIRAIPAEVLEAAALDGASTRRAARSVVLPLLRPLLIVVTIQSIIWDFKVFTQVYVMTGGGGIAGRNLVLNVYAYQEAFAASEYGLGAAIGVVTTLILLAITVFYLRALRRSGEVL